jgi:hypothetical protein
MPDHINHPQLLGVFYIWWKPERRRIEVPEGVSFAFRKTGGGVILYKQSYYQTSAE